MAHTTPSRPSLPSRARLRMILIAALRGSDVIVDMGAKYQPTIRDLKASERFRNKQVSRPMTTKASSDQPIKKEKKSQ